MPSHPHIQPLESRRLLSAILPGFGLYNPATAQLTLDYNRTGAANVNHTLGVSGSQVVAADFNGDTITDTAAFHNGNWSIDLFNDGSIDKTVKFGKAGDIAVAGDVTGSGTAAIGFYNPVSGLWKFSADQNGQVRLQFQDQPGGIPLMADWNGSGHDDLILYKAGTWTVTDPDGTLITTFTLAGGANQVPVIADVNGTGQEDPGFFNAKGVWKFDTARDGVLTRVYKNGAAGDEPLVGDFSPAESIFVAAGASGNGSEQSPFGTIQAAINAAGSGNIIRIAAGNYAENDRMVSQSNVTFIGAGMNATHIDPSSGDALFLALDSGSFVYNLNVDSGDRGLIIQGGSASLRGVSTAGTVNTGVLAVGDQGNASVDAQYCSFDSVVDGMGMWMQDTASLNAFECRFDDNGTDPALSSSDQGHGIGLQVNGASTASCNGCDFSHNHAIGVSDFGSGNLSVTNSTMSFNFVLDGAIVTGSNTAVFDSNTFQQNGPVRSATLGAYGLEIANTFTGPPLTIEDNVFRKNTAAGIFIGNGAGDQITGNSFINNTLGISINGFVDAALSTNPVNTNPTITGNTFKVTDGAANTTGIFALGGGAGGTVGGAGNLENTFKNYDGSDSPAISLSNFGFSPPQVLGTPTTQVLENNYVNSPNPVVREVHS